MNTITAYLTPTSPRFHALDDFQGLKTWQKVITVAATALAALATVLIAGLGGVAVFRLTVDSFKEEEKEIINEIPEKKEIVHLNGYKQLESMSRRQLIELVRSLSGSQLVDFWGFENQAATTYFEKFEIDQMKQRLQIELPTLSIDQFKESLKLPFFWNMLSHLHYVAFIGEILSAEQLGAMGNWLERQRSQDPEQDLSTQKFAYNHIISKIPVENKELLSEKLEAVAPFTTKETEQLLVGKMMALQPTKRKLVRQLSEASLKKQAELPPESKLSALERVKLANKGKRKTWASETVAPPPLPKEPEPHKRSASDDQCRLYLSSWKPHKNKYNDDAFFWTLDNPSEADKGKDYVQAFVTKTTDLNEYKVLEKMSDSQLKAYMTVLENKALDIHWERENYAANLYTEKRELDRMRHRLKIELSGLNEEQVASSIHSESFWLLIGGKEYQATAAQSLTPSTFGQVAEWLDKATEFQDKMRIFKDLFVRIPADEEKEKIDLNQKMLATGSFPFMKESVLFKFNQLRKSDQNIPK